MKSSEGSTSTGPRLYVSSSERPKPKMPEYADEKLRLGIRGEGPRKGTQLRTRTPLLGKSEGLGRELPFLRRGKKATPVS